MSANKIAETSTSTGTGNFTLDGAWSQAGTFNTGNRTFNSFYGLNHYFPYMIQDTVGNWEKGVGYLSSASTLVRSAITNNSLGTTAAINFVAGSKLVMVPTDAGYLQPYSIPSGNVVQTVHQFGVSGGTIGSNTDVIRLCPFVAARPMDVTGLMFEVTTGIASSFVRCGIYSVLSYNPSFADFRLVSTQATVPSDTASNKDCAITARLGAGMYVLAYVSNLNPTLRANQAGVMDVGLTASAAGSISNQQMYQMTIAGASTSLPSTITGALVNPGTAGLVRGSLKGTFL